MFLNANSRPGFVLVILGKAKVVLHNVEKRNYQKIKE
jgi:hypothetical protein